jgi:serine phosphatase RsbU (regulator of sigma subunit)
MDEVDIVSSEALKREQLKSDRIRILALIGVLCFLFAGTLLRRIAFAGTTEKHALPYFVAYFGIMIAYEFMMLLRVGRALRLNADFSSSSLILNAAIETLFPTAGIVLLIATGLTNPYGALLAPIVLTYFLFVASSTLKLRPMLARLTGLFCAAEYAVIAVCAYVLYPMPSVRQAMQPVEYYMSNTVILLASGLLAGEVARQIRSHVSAAVHEAAKVERLHGELESARYVQQSLLPRSTPDLRNYEIAGWNEPADQTGGDYYSWRQLGEGKIAFMLADVTGHGISSALMASACHAYAQASVVQDSNLDAMVTRVNKLLCADLPSGKLITFVAGVLDENSGIVDLLSAGHAPLLLYVAAEDRVQSFEAHGIPFGIFASVAYGPAQKIQLSRGDMLVLITDGFFEWTNAQGEDFGLDRLHAAIRASRKLSAAEVISAIHDTVSRFASGVAQQDDLTAVVIKRVQ